MDFPGLSIDVDNNNEIDISDNCKFSCSTISIKGQGNRVFIDKALSYDHLVIRLVGDNKEVHISDSVRHIRNVKITSIRGDRQTIFIGPNFSCGGLEIQMNDGDENLHIGSDCLFSWGIKIRTSDGHSVVDLHTNKAINLPKDVHIGDRVWVGEDVRFLKGSGVPSDSVVGSGSIMTKSFGDEGRNCVYGGVPARILRRGIKWDRRMPADYNASV